MKLKRLLAGFIAVAMTIGMIPALTFADEAENGTKEPAAVEETEAKEEEKKPAAKETKPAEEKKEPEKKAEPEVKPAESKAEEPAEKEDKKEAEPAATEAPAEPEEKQPAESKEAEPVEKAPEETKKPDTVTGKIPGTSDSSNPKKAPIVVKTITNIEFEGTPTLRWDSVAGAIGYLVQINTIQEYVSNTNRLPNVDKLINNAIKEGRLKKTADSKYKISVFAYDTGDFLIGKGSREFTFGNTMVYAEEPSLASIPGAKIKKDRLYWNAVKGKSVNEYEIFINGILADYRSKAPGKKGISLKTAINYVIKDGRVEKSSDNKYSVTLLAYNNLYEVVARYTGTVTYKTTAKPTQYYTFDNVNYSNGRIKWDAVKGTSYYVFTIRDPYGGSEDLDWKIKSTSFDINDAVGFVLDYDESDYSHTINYFVDAYNSNKEIIATYGGYVTLVRASNPLSVSGKTAKVKYSKLKKKKQTLKASQVINGVGTGRGPMTFTKVSVHKNISINKSNGKVTIKKKGLKKGKTYSVTVTVFDQGHGGYYPSEEKTVTFRIKVKK